MAGHKYQYNSIQFCTTCETAYTTAIIDKQLKLLCRNCGHEEETSNIIVHRTLFDAEVVDHFEAKEMSCSRKICCKHTWYYSRWSRPCVVINHKTSGRCQSAGSLSAQTANMSSLTVGTILNFSAGGSLGTNLILTGTYPGWNPWHVAALQSPQGTLCWHLVQ